MIRKMFAAALCASASSVVAQPAQVQAPAVVPAAPAPPAAPDPTRLAAAERLVAAMWSDELFTRAIEAGLAQEVPGWSAPPPDPSDPYHGERTRLRHQATRSELLRAVQSFAPEMRSLAARFYASRLSLAELDEAARFYAGPAGRRFVAGSIETIRHADALRNYNPEPSPELIAAGVRLAMRVQMETRHLAPPPPPPPPRADRERRRTERPSRRQESERRQRRGERPPEVPVLDSSPPEPPAPPAPPPPPADPARLEAARRAAEAILPTEAFSQPLPLQATVEGVLALPVSAFVPIAPPGTVNPNASLGQAALRWDPHFEERARIVSRIASEELPRLLPHAAPLLRGAIAELYARTFTVAELDAVTGFYATPAGRALARESFTALVDPQFVRGMLLLVPRVGVEGLGAMFRIGQATVHLPPPPAPPPVPAPAPAADPDPDGGDDD
jgi:hypothetical protein